MNNLAHKITLAVAGIFSVAAIIMLVMIMVVGNDSIVAGEAEVLKNTFIYLVLTMFVISVLYFIIAGILSLISNPTALKKDALPLTVLVLIGILLFWIYGLDSFETLGKANFINMEDSILIGYHGLSGEQLGSISLWRLWLSAGLGLAGFLLLLAMLSFLYDMVKSVIK